jgi:uncharacterized membrane protein YphA (DoxX/SURF4 family)
MALALLLGRLLLAAVFLAAGMAKLRDLPGSRHAIGEFGVPARAAGVLGTLLPLAELTITGALIAGPTATWGALAALALLLLFCVAIAWNLSHGRAPDCHCFGQLHSTPASRRTVARNLGLAALAFLLAAGLGALAPAAAIAAVGIAALVAGPLPAWLRRRGDGEASAGDATGAPEGLPVGTPAPDFRLASLSGDSHTLDSLRASGRPLLLLFSDPNCGPCIEMAPMVARWQRQHSDELTIAVIEGDHDGEAVAPDEHGRRNVLLERESEVSGAYGTQGTPSAVLVGREGAIASPVAAGAGEIEALLARTLNGFLPVPGRTVARRALGPPLRRRELLVRGAGAWVATTAVLAWPAQALAGIGLRRQRRAEACEDVFDCPEHGFMRCRNGRCVCGEDPFGRPTARCDPEEATTQRCFSLSQSDNHCGRCNRSCPDGERCCDYECAPRGRSRCNCGGDFCDDNEICRTFSSGAFCDICSEGRRPCGNKCGDPQTQRCCGERLYEQERLGPGNWECCRRGGHRPRLFDTDRSTSHCGGCNKPCERGELCYRGKCRKRCPPGRRRCGRTCGNPRTQACCGGRLIAREDLLSDEKNCGACGSKCPEEPRYKCCPTGGKGKCANTLTDGEHCSGCGQFCSGLPGAPNDTGCECRNGGCVPRPIYAIDGCTTCPCI